MSNSSKSNSNAKRNSRRNQINSKKQQNLASIAQCRKIKLVSHELNTNSSNGVKGQQASTSSLDSALLSFISKLPRATGDNLESILNSIHGILKSKSVTFPMKDIITNLGELLNRKLKKKYRDSLFSILKLLCQKYATSIENHFGDLVLYIKFALQQPAEEVQKFALSVSILILDHVNLHSIPFPVTLIEGLIYVVINNTVSWRGMLSEFRLKLLNIEKKTSAQQWSTTLLIPLMNLLKILMDSFIQKETKMSVDDSQKELDILTFIGIDCGNLAASNKQVNLQDSAQGQTFVMEKFTDIICDFMLTLAPSKLSTENSLPTTAQQGSKVYPEVAELLSIFSDLLIKILDYCMCQSRYSSHFELSNKLFQFLLTFFEQNFPFFTLENSTNDSRNLYEQFKPFIRLNLLLTQLLIKSGDRIQLGAKTKALIYSYLTKIFKLEAVDEFVVSTLENIFTEDLFPSKAVENICSAAMDIFLKLKLEKELRNRLLRIITSKLSNVDLSKLIGNKECQKEKIEKFLIIQLTCDDEISQRKWFYKMLSKRALQYDDHLMHIVSMNAPNSQQEFKSIVSLIDNTQFIIGFEKLLALISNISKTIPTESFLNFKLFIYFILFEPRAVQNDISKTNRAMAQIAACYFIQLKNLKEKFIPEILNYLPKFKEIQLKFETMFSARLCNFMVGKENELLSRIAETGPDLVKSEIDEFFRKNSELYSINDIIKAAN